MDPRTRRALIEVRRDHRGSMTVTAATTAAELLLGYPRGDLRGETWGPQLEAVDAQRVLDGCTAVIDRHRLAWTGDAGVVRRAGSRVHLAVTRPGGSIRPRLVIELTEATGPTPIADCSTEQAEVVSALLDTENRLTVITDETGVVQHFSPEAETLSGFSADEVIGCGIWRLCAPEERAEVRARFRQPGFPGSFSVSTGSWVPRNGQRRSIGWVHTALDAPLTRILMTGVDLTEQRFARGLLESARADATSHAVIGTDVGGMITFFNPAAERMTGLLAEEVVGRTTPIVLHDPPEIAERAREIGVAPGYEVVLGTVSMGGATAERDWTYVHRSGARVIVSTTVSAVRDRKGQIIGHLTLAKEVTEARAAHARLQDMLAKEHELVVRLTALDRARNEFITAVNHELRTPLTSIVGYTEVLLEDELGPLTDPQRRFVEKIARNGHRLQRQVEDLLLLTEVDAGSLTVDRSEIELRDVVAEALDDLDPDSRRRVDVETGTEPTPILGDFSRLVGVVRALVDNALKFSLVHDQVRVRLRRDGTQQALEISDSGVGIPAIEQEHLFGRFYRAAPANALAAQGLGLGLAVAAAVVARHDGDVSISSVEGAGTTVVVRLPACPAAVSQTAPSGRVSSARRIQVA